MTQKVKGVKAILIIREVDYAVRILSELHKNSPLSAAELAERQNIPCILSGTIHLKRIVTVQAHGLQTLFIKELTEE